jgi:segregation and condensation protein A
MSFLVELDLFRGPLDLLLYLVRKQEVDVVEIPIAVITEQFLQYLEVLQVLDVNDVGEFIEMASTLIEVKSRLVLPRGGEETEELEDPRDDLVQRLLEYKKFRDASSLLEEQSREWQKHLPRLANDLPPRKVDLAGQPVQEVELWDLVSAFGRIVRESQTPRASNIVYDETPIHVHMQHLHERMLSEGRAAFSQMFVPGMHKTALIGVFLAILELVRHHRVRTQQDDGHGEIWVLPGEQFDEALDLSNVDTYGQPPSAAAEAPLKPR